MRVARSRLAVLLALLPSYVHATRCEETSCDSYCDPLQQAHCSFCSCRTCMNCLNSPTTRGPQHVEPEPGKSKEREPTAEDTARSDAEPGGRSLPPAHARTAEECVLTCSALKGAHCASTKCQGCPFCVALRARSVAAPDDDEASVALADCGWLEQLTDARKTYGGGSCTRFTGGGRGQCEVHYVSTNDAAVYRRCLWTDTCAAGRSFSCGDKSSAKSKAKIAAVLGAPLPVLGIHVLAEESSRGKVALRLSMTPARPHVDTATCKVTLWHTRLQPPACRGAASPRISTAC